MNPFWLAFGAVIGLAVANQVVLRVPSLRRNAFVFWSNLGMQALGAVLGLLVGLPGTEAMPAIRLLLAGLFAFHVVQDLAAWRADGGHEDVA